VRITTVRQDVVNGVTYTRESAPSMCRITASIGGLGQGLQVQVSNVPGAKWYYVYTTAANGTCAGPFGYVGKVSGVGTMSNSSTSGCPSVTTIPTCTLGAVSHTFDNTEIPNGFTPSASAAPGTQGAYPPSEQTSPSGAGAFNNDPPAGVPPAGDRGNFGFCADGSANAVACPPPGSTTPGFYTPGAIIFYFPTGACMNLSSGVGFNAFSGIQYSNVVIYAPLANTCSMAINGYANTVVTGVTYLPGGALTIAGNSTYQAPVYGAIVVNTCQLNGSAGVTIKGPTNMAATAASSKLVQ
jgi:hypothetical protein